MTSPAHKASSFYKDIIRLYNGIPWPISKSGLFEASLTLTFLGMVRKYHLLFDLLIKFKLGHQKRPFIAYVRSGLSGPRLSYLK